MAKFRLKTRGRDPTQSGVREAGIVERLQMGKYIALRRRPGGNCLLEACGGGMPFPGPQAPAAQRVDTNPQFFGGLCGLSPLLCHQARRACFEFLILSWWRRPFFSFFLFHIFCPFPFYLTTRFSVRQYGYGALDCQQAGITAGKDGNRFDPQGTAARAEAAAVLRRFVEAVIDPQTVQGWTQNQAAPGSI